MNAAIEFIRITGASPAISPEGEDVGVTILSSATQLADVDAPSPTGIGGVPIPSIGENRSIIVALALRVVQPADPVTILSDVRFFVSQANLNSVGGDWDGINLWTPKSTTDTDLLDAFVAFGGSVGAAADYVQATRSQTAQGWIGDDIEDVYGIADLDDVLAFPNAGRLDLTGLGREDGTVDTFGHSGLDCSKLMLLQAALTSACVSGAKPTLPLSCRWSESL